VNACLSGLDHERKTKRELMVSNEQFRDRLENLADGLDGHRATLDMLAERLRSLMDLVSIHTCTDSRPAQLTNV
jgi:hypothetical protein